MNDLVSVVIPTKNRIDTIKRAINSVFNQTYKNLELIVVDDGSNDDTVNFLNDSFNEIILVKNQASLGGAVARNQGFNVSKGKYIAFLDSDDEWLPSHIEDMLSFIKQNNLKGAFSAFSISYDNGKSIFNPNFRTKLHKENVLKYILSSGDGGDIRTSTLVLDSKSFNQIKFDENLKKYQDWDLAIRFDQEFDLGSLNKRNSILHVKTKNRMSDKLNLEATQIFYSKNLEYFPKKMLFEFFIKLTYKAALLGLRDENEFKYFVKKAKEYLKYANSKKNALKLFILKFPIINFARIYFKMKRLLNT